MDPNAGLYTPMEVDINQISKVNFQALQAKMYNMEIFCLTPNKLQVNKLHQLKKYYRTAMSKKTMAAATESNASSFT